MFNNIDLYNPDKIIRCSSLIEPSEVYDIMKSMRAESYAYCIAYIPSGKLLFEVIKFGLSSPKKDRISDCCGERLVRQISHVDGWNKTFASANGFDFANGINQMKKKGILPKNLNKNDLIIGIWNTSYNFRGACKSQYATAEEQSMWLEGELCNQYKKKNNGNLPPLNIADPTSTDIYKNPIMFASSESSPTGIELFKF